MEKVDELIETLAEHVLKLINNNEKVLTNEIEKETKALAELVTARAGCRGKDSLDFEKEGV